MTMCVGGKMWDYYKDKKEVLSEELFRKPTSAFRGAPLWAWNTKLNQEQLVRQIEYFQKMGMGGFHIHVRAGLQTEYLSEEFMDCVRLCVEKAKKLKMLCWLYDEDRWPSGTAGGHVTMKKKFRARYLVFTPNMRGAEYCENKDIFYEAQDRFKGYLLAKFRVVLKNGFLYEYKRIDDEQSLTEDNIWWAYLEVAEETAWYNYQTYVNTLDKEAIEYFVGLTHDAYYKSVGDEFGQVIPAIFTDEPQFREKQCLNFPDERRDIIIPFTDDFDDTYFELYKEHILERLPELVWQLKDNEISLARYHYHDHLCERFAKAYTDTIGKWCDEHELVFTGHLMQEPYLSSQTQSLGEAMRLYRSFQLPGVDMLCNGREFTTLKQAQSVSHQFGRSGVLCEMYGVTNWNFSFKEHKLAGDWQAALGVTTRAHHLAWLSMAGERKRDYPASIGYQSPWYTEYSYIEDYFARINTALTRGKPQVRVGVVHPIESYWLYWGPTEQTAGIRQEIENNFQGITQWLLMGLIDFDFISESLLPNLIKKPITNTIEIGEMKYDAIVIPGCITLREDTIDYLEKFYECGGKIIFVGSIPKYIAGMKSNRAKELAQNCICVPFSKDVILDALCGFRDIDISQEDGNRTNNLIYQMRIEDEKKWLFICHVNDMDKTSIMNQIFNQEWDGLERITITIKGCYSARLYDTISGEIRSYSTVIRGEDTIIKYEFYSQDSVLFLLEPSNNTVENQEVCTVLSNYKCMELLAEPVSINLLEPNVLLLDMAEYRLDDGEWQATEEILRIDEMLRYQLGYSQRTYGKAQPWLEQESREAHSLKLRYTIKSKIVVQNPVLALEGAKYIKMSVNGCRVDLTNSIGYYVDESIEKFVIPALNVGDNELIMELPFTENTDLECLYLLGEFGVRVTGKKSIVEEFNSNLCYGDWTIQGFPFYSGNMTYECDYDSDGSDIMLRIPNWEGSVISVAVDGEKIGNIAFEPNAIKLGVLGYGKHRISITVYGNRFNTFGAIHNCVKKYQWFGPNAWRTKGTEWAYQYQLKEMGILSTPLIYKRDKNE